MLVRHFANNQYLENDIPDPVAIFLAQQGSWFSQWNQRQTRYEGWFVPDNQTLPHRYFKLIDRISLIDQIDQTPDQLWIQPNAACFRWEKAHLRIFNGVPNSLTLIASREAKISLQLDTRGIYLFPEFDREYAFADKSGGVLITYTDSLLSHPLYLHIRGPIRAHHCQPGSWEPVQYPRDKARHSKPTDRYLYLLPPLAADRLDLGFGLTPEAAVKASAKASDLACPAFVAKNPADPLEFARAGAKSALQKLKTDDGYYAGLPWFHQFWSRDELIAGLGLEPADQLQLIQSYLKLPLEHGELPTFAGSGSTCADGVGWLALLLQAYGPHKLSPEDQHQAQLLFTTAYQQLNQDRRTPSGLIWSNPNATWMDTIGRSGCRLEIQTMYGLLLQILHQLSGNHRFAVERLAFLEQVRHRLWEKPQLLDGLDDQLQPDLDWRPNLFLAYLFQPDLLTPEDWKLAFGQALAHLQLDWGGLASVDPASPVFQGQSTGEDNRSYHQGDSWFFINNLAALALQRLDPVQFALPIQSLLAASQQEILWQHFLGYPGEIAGAKAGDSWGCGIQAFSAGTYLLATALASTDAPSQSDNSSSI